MQMMFLSLFHLSTLSLFPFVFPNSIKTDLKIVGSQQKDVARLPRFHRPPFHPQNPDQRHATQSNRKEECLRKRFDVANHNTFEVAAVNLNVLCVSPWAVKVARSTPEAY